VNEGSKRAYLLTPEDIEDDDENEMSEVVRQHLFAKLFTVLFTRFGGRFKRTVWVRIQSRNVAGVLVTVAVRAEGGQ
jgi:hypothetical protein